MYASIRSWQLKGDVEGLDERLESEFIPGLRRLAGFCDYYFVRTDENEVTTVTVFETLEGAQESSRYGREWGSKALGNQLAGPPVIREGEVTHHTHGEQHEARETVATEQPAMH